MSANDTITFTARGFCGVPALATAIIANVTIVDPSTSGFLTTFAADVPRPTTSTLNWDAGTTALANQATISLSSAGKFSVYNLTGTADVVIDVSGYMVPASPGSKGDTGATGAAGDDGIDGIDGDTGAAGAEGADGSNGASGTNGLNGATGADGIDGATGQNGADGDTGAPGADGIDGATGQNGADGATGRNGADGDDGAPGADGDDGATGQDGADGAPGAPGAGGASYEYTKLDNSGSGTTHKDLVLGVADIALTADCYTMWPENEVFANVRIQNQGSPVPVVVSNRDGSNVTLSDGQWVLPIYYSHHSPQTAASVSTMIVRGDDAWDVEIRMNIEPSIGKCHLYSIVTRLSPPAPVV